MKIVIIDDESNARSLLRSVVTDYDTTIEVLEANTLKKGVSIIKAESPNIVFLDIEMPEHSGLEILDFIDEENINFEIIFVTAYDQYAIKAFELSALDYLLKPIQPKRVFQALQKTKTKNTSNSQLLDKLKSIEIKLQKKSFRKIKLPLDGGITFLDVEEVLYLTANGMYTKVFFASGNELLLTKPLKQYLTIFNNQLGFFRTHRKYLINIHNVKEYKKKDGGYVIMEDNFIIPVSREKKEKLIHLINML